MHIPDGFVSGPINSLGAVLSTAAIAYSLTQVQKELEQRPFLTPLLATTAAFVFAAQMLNFPIGGGTSGHFLGATLAAALLGPWSACLALTVVLIIQTLLFGDGGLSALGTNIFNMGVIGGVLVYPLLRAIHAWLPKKNMSYLLAAGIASWLSVVLASSFCAVELAFSGTSPLRFVLPAMAATHMIIGIGEALITVTVLSAIAASRPDIPPAWAGLGQHCQPQQQQGRQSWKVAGLGLAFSLLLAMGISPFASSAPDGLEKVAEDKGFLEAASAEKVVWNKAVLPDYSVPGMRHQGMSTSMAGLIGALSVFVAGFFLIRLRQSRSGMDASPDNES